MRLRMHTCKGSGTAVALVSFIRTEPATPLNNADHGGSFNYEVKKGKEKGVCIMLNPKQVECLKLMMQNPRIKGKELAALLKVNEKTISQWKNKNTEFQDEYNALVRSKIQYAATQALGTQIDLLQSKNDMVAHLAAKDLMDRAGFNPVEKVEQQVDMDLNITVDYGDAE